jgi:hypothetical protein
VDWAVLAGFLEAELAGFLVEASVKAPVGQAVLAGSLVAE